MSGNEPFTQAQIWDGVIPEFGSTKFVLLTGERLLRNAAPFARDRDAIFACLAVGVEKLVKLALGLLDVADGKPWPRMNLTREGWGHATAQMDTRLRAALAHKIDAGEYPGEVYLRQLLCTVENDAVWSYAVRAFEAYGDKGRFFYLDKIAGNVGNGENPLDDWERAEHAALEADPALLAMQVSAGSQFETALSGALADSIVRWWAMVTLMGMHGVLGEWGKQFGADLLPDGATSAKIVPDCMT